jgi:capsular polysaccharide transport system permease protein
LYYLLTHLRVVSAFTMREISTRYGRSPGGYIWAFVEPAAYIFIMSSLREALGGLPAEGDSYVLFFATGYLAYMLYNGMYHYLASSISANKSLMRYPTVAPIDAVVGRFMLQALTSAVVSTVIIAGSYLTVRHSTPIQWELVLGASAFAWLLALGVSFANIVLFVKFPIYEKLFAVVSRPLLLLSGVFIIPTDLPHPMSDILLDNPITHIVMLFRDGLDVWYLAICSSVTFVIGFAAFTLWPVARERD